MASILAGLEIGTTRTIVSIGEVIGEDESRVKLVGIGESQSIGVRKGQIIDLEQLKNGIESAAREAEEMANINLFEVVQGITGGHIKITSNPGTLAINSNDKKVTREDMDVVCEIAEEVPLDSERQILHTVPQPFELDGQPGIVNPVGMRCSILSTSVLAIHGIKNRITNAANAAERAHLDVVDVAYTGICSALAVLTPEQKRNGVAVIDLGGGVTDYVVYVNDVILTAGTLALGGDHITNDIAIAFNINLTQAEELKRKEGSAVVSGASNRRVTVEAGHGFDSRQISCVALHTVINARLEEIFKLLRTIMFVQEEVPSLGSGIVLTGGGAYLNQATELCHRVFGLPSMVGKVVNVDGFDEFEQPASYAAAAGLLDYGRRSYRSPSLLSQAGNYFKGIFRRRR